MDDLEKRVNEKEKQVLKIVHAVDYITQKLSPQYGEFFQYDDNSGSMEIKDFYGYRVEVHGQPIVLHRNRMVNNREYTIVKLGEEGGVGWYVFGAEYSGSEKDVMLKAIWEEMLTGFMNIANNPKKYVREYLNKKAEEERNNKRWRHTHRKEIGEEKRRQKLISRAEELQVRD